MGLRAKFNLVLLAAFVVGLALASAVSYRLVNANARREVIQEASLMLAQARAIQDYTVKEIRPLLAEQMKTRFLPHTVPAWAAQTNLRALSAQFPDYTYKDAMLNSTNPSDRATDWETAIIGEFRNSATLAEYVTTRDTPAGPILSISRPIRITDKDCLICHSTPAAAPAPMIDLYGSANGFDWKLGEVLGAQIVSVPMRVALDRANEVLKVYLVGLTSVFALTILLLNLMLHHVVLKPIRQMSAIASEVSLGNEAPEFVTKGSDEISSLAQSFTRMRRSLVNAMQMLET